MGGPQQSPAKCLAFACLSIFFIYKSYAKGNTFA
jgi:hypothetical protein